MARRFALVLMGVTGMSLLLRVVVHQSNPSDALPSICLAATGFGLIGLVLGRIAEHVVLEAVDGLNESEVLRAKRFYDSTYEIR